MKQVAGLWMVMAGIGLSSLGSGSLYGQSPAFPHPVRDAAAQTSELTQKQKQGLWESVSASEYHIREDMAPGTWTSPNRAHNLRTTFTEKGFSLKPRVESQEQWNLQYEVLGLFRNNGCVLALQGKPASENEGNKLSLHYANGFHIEYENSEKGMRQNFLVDGKPSGEGMLRVVLATEGSLFPVKKGNGDVVLVEENPATGAMVNRAWYRDLRVMDATGRIMPASVEVGAVRKGATAGSWHSEISLQVDDRNAIYPLWIDPISTTAAAVVEGNQTMAQLGTSVSSAGDVNGDGYSDVIVGATGYDNGQTDEGAAFIYHGSATGISTTAATMLESNQANANFGWSVSTAGDVNGDGFSDVIVGAPYYDIGGANSGMIFIYHGSSSGIPTIAAATRNVAQANALLGSSVATAGDLNNDGYSDVVAGAPQYDNTLTDEGRVVIFHGSVSGIVSSPSATVSGGQGFAKLGYSVASGGDLNNDGYSDVLMGAPYYDKGQANEGAIFAFKGSATGMSTTLVDTLEANTASALLGWAVACAGDVNGDGFSDVVAGAPFFANDSTAEGAAFIFHGNALGVSSTVIASVEGNQVSANMGASVASAGDVNGDGYSDVLVGAYGFDNGTTDEGAAFLYQGSATGISTTASALLECNNFEAYMGAVASAGDVNGDGYSDLVIGASGYSNPDSYEGAFFVYHGAPGGVSTTVASSFESNQNTGFMGFSVASAGDVNGDGYSDVIVGAYGFDNGSTDEGAAFIYHGSATGLASTAAIMLEPNQANAFMGVSVASAGDVNGDGFSDVIVGVMGYSSIEVFEGGAFIYHGSASGITTPAAAVVESNQLNAFLGRCVASAGDVNGDGFSDVIVSAPSYDNGSTDEGACFIYHGSASGISTTAAATVESNQANANMGVSLASAGDVNGDGFSDVVVGVFNYDNGQTDEGRAYIYHGSAAGINTTAAATVESNQAGANMGSSVASAGDVNGDGYSDVVIGSLNYSRGETNEGVAFVYHGSASGMGTTAVDTLEPNIAFAAYGSAVASAGDVNGDGYSDVVVGAQFAANGQSNEGIVYVYHGSPTGVINTPAGTFERNQANAYLGASVASAGDVNGDGYSDIIMGAYNYDNGQSDEGTAFVHYGNGGSGLPTMARQFRPSSTTPVGPGGLSESSGLMRIAMTGKSFLGNQKGKMTYEYKTQGVPFTSAGGKVTNSVASTGSTIAFVPMSGTGTAFVADLIGLAPAAAYKWRSRIKYNPATAITGQMYGPWYYHKSRTPEVPMLGFRAKTSCTLSTFGTCPSAQTLSNSPGTCSAIASYTASATGTPAPTLSYTFSGATIASGSGTGSGSTFNQGVTNVVVTATNSCGPVTCSFTVTVNDTTDPNAICKNITVYLDGAGSASITGASLNNGSTDNCTSAGSLALSPSVTSFSCANIGPNTAILTVTDASGNSKTCTSTVTVADTMDPTATCKNATVYLNAAGSASITGASLNNGSTDNCTAAGSLTLSPSVSSFSCANIGSNAVILTVTDAQGNSKTCSSTVTVADSVDPTALCKPATVSLNAAGIGTLAASAVDNGSTDNCTAAGSLTLSVSPSSYSCSNLGSNTATLTVTDASGNSSTCTATVTVIDAVAPTAFCLDIEVDLDSVTSYTLPASLANGGSTDNCTASGSLTFSLSPATYTCADMGVNTATLTVTDASGNSSTCTSTVTVYDILPAVMVCANPTVQLTAGGYALITPSLLDGGSTDNCSITSLTVSQDSVTCADFGTVSIDLVGVDADGNISSCTATVTVVDTTGVTDPGVDLGPDAYICTGTLVMDAGAGYPSYLWSTGATTQTLSTTVPGTFSVTVTTALGCEGTDELVVNAGTMPTVDLGADTVQCGSIDLDAGNPGATYAWSTTATSQVISVSTSGTYTVTVTLGPGCVASDDITVTILALPTVTFDYPDDTICKELGAVTLLGESPAGGTWSGPGVTGSTFDPNVAGVGIHTLTYTYTDAATGCSASANDVVVVDICIGVQQQQTGIDATVYPNPNGGAFQLQVTGLSGESLSVEVWSVDGKLVWQHQDQSVSGLSITPIDLSHLSKGVYMVKVLGGTHQQVLRVVTQ